ncbi:ABC transporter permease [Pseudarthrobacter sp. YAF2]|uniref:ABC transporter permease n=1 Tax=Pseudarthrobacter sp. YAF2 TaxID=3233078 RepID=UPI003F9CA536
MTAPTELFNSPAPIVPSAGGRPKRGYKKLSPRRGIVSGPVLVVLGILIVVPAGLVLLAAFSTDVPRPGNISWNLTLQNFSVLLEGQTINAFFNSILISTLATVFACFIGGSLAFLAARTDIPMPRFIYLIGLMPIFLPSYTGALSWSILGSPTAGLLNIAQRDMGTSVPLNMYSIGGVVFVFALYYSPYTFLMVHGAMSMMSPDLEEAARVHGATQNRMQRLISFPLAMPALLGSALLTFILVFENFPVSQVLATPGGIDTLPTLIYRLLNTSPSRGNESAAIAIVLVAVVLLVTALQRRMLAKRSYTTVSGKGVRQKKVILGRYRIPALVLALLFFFLSVVLPVLALVVVAAQKSRYLTSLSQLTKPGSWDFSSFAGVLGSSRFLGSAANSLVVGLFAASAGVVLAFICGYLVYRSKAAGRLAIEGTSMVPLAIPSIVLGMGLLWTWLIMPVPLYGTLAVLVIAFMAVQSPQGFRGIAASILATDRDLEDSAVMLGASRPRAVMAVTVPLMKIGLLSTFLLLLMLSMRELTVPLFLSTRSTEILSVTIYEAFETGGALQEAAAMSVVYMALMFVLSYIPRRLSER